MDETTTAALARPFKASEVEWRIGQSGVSNGKPWATVFCYVQSRAVYTRLNEVFGVNGWKNSFEEQTDVNGKLNYFQYTLSIWDKEAGHWIDKTDVAEPTAFEPFKGGVSDGAKRAAVLLGIGAYLYSLGVTFAQFHERRVEGSRKAKVGNDWFHWTPPQLPEWALPND
jgi:hypothetical protein